MFKNILKKIKINKKNILNNSLRTFYFIFIFLLAILFYKFFLTKHLTNIYHFFFYILFWLFLAYIVFPLLNRFFTNIFLPHYYIGQSKTSDGVLGDSINLMFNGDKEDIKRAFLKSGFDIPDKITIKSSIKISIASIFKKSYPNAPISPLYLFNKKEDLAFEIQIDGNPRQRHHIRIWKSPEDWYLPGGFQSDYLAAASFDKNIGFSLFGGEITHHIDGDIDKERDFVLKKLTDNNTVLKSNLVKHFTSSYHSRNGGGDKISTDGTMPFVTIKKENK